MVTGERTNILRERLSAQGFKKRNVNFMRAEYHMYRGDIEVGLKYMCARVARKSSGYGGATILNREDMKSIHIYYDAIKDLEE